MIKEKEIRAILKEEKEALAKSQHPNAATKAPKLRRRSQSVRKVKKTPLGRDVVEQESQLVRPQVGLDGLQFYSFIPNCMPPPTSA